MDLTDKSVALTAAIVFRIAFGKRFEGGDFRGDRFHELVSEVEAMLGSYSASEYFAVPFVGKLIDRISGRHGRLERVFNELDALFQEVIDEHLRPERIKAEEDDIIDVLLGISKQQHQSGSVAIAHENIKAILLVSNFLLV